MIIEAAGMVRIMEENNKENCQECSEAKDQQVNTTGIGLKSPW